MQMGILNPFLPGADAFLGDETLSGTMVPGAMVPGAVVSGAVVVTQSLQASLLKAGIKSWRLSCSDEAPRLTQ